MKRLIFTTVITAGLLLPVWAQTADTEVGRRQERQQARIAQGAKSGKLTPGQTATLEHKEGKIHHEVKHMRAANGGKLTAGEKAKVNHQQNKVSRQIRRTKHS
jgi:hypothetical protein